MKNPYHYNLKDIIQDKVDLRYKHMIHLIGRRFDKEVYLYGETYNEPPKYPNNPLIT